MVSFCLHLTAYCICYGDIAMGSFCLHLTAYCIAMVTWPWVAFVSSGHVTIWVLYKHKCCPFEVATAPAIFQKLLESDLNGIPNFVLH